MISRRSKFDLLMRASGRSELWAESLAVCIRLQVFPYRRSLPRAAVSGGVDIRTSPARTRFGLIVVGSSVNGLWRRDRPSRFVGLTRLAAAGMSADRVASSPGR